MCPASPKRQHAAALKNRKAPSAVEMYQTARRLVEQGLIDQDIPTPSRIPSNKTHSRGKAEVATDNEDSGNGRFFKTRICLFHQKGACVKGVGCTYAHSESELRESPDLVKTRLCQDWLNGRCTTERCKFAHGRQELRFTRDYYKTKLCHFWQLGGCTKGELCRHAHGSDELRSVATLMLKNGEVIDTRLGENDYECIPAPGHTTNVPGHGDTIDASGHGDNDASAVLRALRLAERARLLVMRSSELFTDQFKRSDAGGECAAQNPCTTSEFYYPRSSMSSTVAPSSYEDTTYNPSPSPNRCEAGPLDLSLDATLLDLFAQTTRGLQDDDDLDIDNLQNDVYAPHKNERCNNVGNHRKEGFESSPCQHIAHQLLECASGDYEGAGDYKCDYTSVSTRSLDDLCMLLEQASLS